MAGTVDKTGNASGSVSLMHPHVKMHLESLPTSDVLHYDRSKSGHFSRPTECPLSQLLIDEGSCQNRQYQTMSVTRIGQ